MTLRISEVARAAGVNRETMRYYERRGLIDQPQRSLGGHRLYDDGVVRTVRVIKAAQRLGFSLDEVAELRAAGRRNERRSNSQEDAVWPARARAKLADIESRIAGLAAVRDQLRAASDAGCEDVDECVATDECPLGQALAHTPPCPGPRPTDR